MQATPLKLEDPAALPEGLRAELREHAGLLRSTDSIENIIRGAEIGPIAEALDEYLKRQRIHAYHCTREPEPGYFEANGLRRTNIAQHQAEFLRRFGHHFTAAEIEELKTRWRYFDESQRNSREGKVCACLTSALVLSDGARPFFEAYGGEAIYMPLPKGSSVWEKLCRLGSPVVVEVALHGDSISAFYGMATCVLSHYHRAINPNARVLESEAHYRGDVAPPEVLRVVPLEQFRP